MAWQAFFDAYKPVNSAGQQTPDAIGDSTVSESWGSTITNRMLMSMGVFLIAVFVYITIRLQREMAVAAILALFVDSASPSMPDRDYTRTHPAPKAFDPNRTQYTYATWTPPSDTDAEAEQWYRAATLLHAQSWRRTAQELQDMDYEIGRASCRERV